MTRMGPQGGRPPRRSQNTRNVRRLGPDGRPLSEQPQADMEVVHEPTLVEPTLVQESISQKVNRHLDTSDINERTQRLGQSVELADDRLESHLQDTFDHHTGTITDQPTVTDDFNTPPETPPPFRIAELLKSPDSVRNAILLSEILRRPEERW